MYRVPIIRGHPRKSQIAKPGFEKYLQIVDFLCFILEKDGSVVHYFLVYENALNSPLAKTPFRKSIIQKGESYLGTTFTSPDARGLWIAPISLSAILLYLRDTVKSKKTYVLVHKDTPGAVEFYKKLGFNVIENACKRNYFLL